MRRKVIQQNPTTLVVSLPARWVKKNNIRKGDEVDIIEDQAVLHVAKDGQQKRERETTITLNNNDKIYVRSIISSAYRAGYTKINISYPDISYLKTIQGITDSLLGLEVIDYSEKSCAVKNLILEYDTNIENIIIKMFMGIKLLQGLITELMNGTEIDSSETGQIKMTNMKQRDYCQRLIALEQPFGHKNFEYYTFIFILEKISGRHATLAEYLIANKPKISKDVLEYYRQTEKLFDSVFNMFKKKDISLGVQLSREQIISNKKEILANSLSQKMSKHENDAMVLSFCYCIRRLIFAMNSKLFGMLV